MANTYADFLRERLARERLSPTMPIGGSSDQVYSVPSGGYGSLPLAPPVPNPRLEAAQKAAAIILDAKMRQLRVTMPQLQPRVAPVPQPNIVPDIHKDTYGGLADLQAQQSAATYNPATVTRVPVTPAPPINQNQANKFFEENTQLPTGTLPLTPEQQTSSDVQSKTDEMASVNAQIDTPGTQENDAYLKYINMGMTATDARDMVIKSISSESVKSIGLGTVFSAMNIVDKPRQLVVTEMGANAYDVASGKSDKYSAGMWAGLALGNWQVDLPGWDPVSLNQSFENFANDPQNWQAIRNASENGFQATGTDPLYTGGRAVWELFIHTKGNAYRFFADLWNDPTIFLPAGKEAGDKLIESGLRTAADGSVNRSVLKTVIGNVLATPQNVMNVTVDAPFNALGAAIKRGFEHVPGRLLEHSAQVQSAEDINTANELLTHQQRIRDQGLGLDPTEPGGPPAPPPDVPSTPEMPRYTKQQINGEWVIIDPNGNAVPGEVYPYRPPSATDITDNMEARTAQRRVNELNYPRVRSEATAMGAVLPPEKAGLTWTDPLYDPLTGRGKDAPMTVQSRVAFMGNGDPLARKAWLDEWTPKAVNHEEIMADFTRRETSQSTGVSFEKDLVQKGTQLLYPEKVYEMMRFSVDDTIVPYLRQFPGQSIPVHQWIVTDNPLRLTNGDLDPNNKIVTLMEYSVFGTREEAISARKALRFRNFAFDGMDPHKSVERLAEMGVNLHGEGWRSTNPSAVKSRTIRNAKPPAGTVDEAAVAEIAGRRETPGTIKRANPGMSYKDAAIESQRIKTEANAKLVAPKQAELLVDTVTVDPAQGDAALVQALQDPAKRPRTPGGNWVKATEYGTVTVKKTGDTKSLITITKEGNYWNVVARSGDPPVPLGSLSDAIAFSDELLTRYSKGIELAPEQVSRVVDGIESRRNIEDVVTVPKVGPRGERYIYIGRTPEDTPVRIAEVRTRQDPMLDVNQQLMVTYRVETRSPDWGMGASGSSREWRIVDDIGGYVGISDPNDLMGLARKQLSTIESFRAREAATYAGKNPGKLADYRVHPEQDIQSEFNYYNEAHDLTGQMNYPDAINVNPKDTSGSLYAINPRVAKSINLGERARQNILKRAGALEGPGASEADILARNDTSYIGAAYQMGKIDTETYLGLNQMVEWENQQMRLWEAYDAAEAWLGDPAAAKRVIAAKMINPQTAAEIMAQNAKRVNKSGETRKVYKLISAYETTLTAQRQNIMFNWARGASSALADYVGTNYSLLINGELDAVKRNMNLIGSARHFIQDERGKGLVVDNLPGMAAYKHQNGVEPYAEVMQLVETRFETMHQGIVLEKLPGYRFTRVLADKLIMAVRTAMDRNSRFALHMAAYQRNIDHNFLRFRGMVAERARVTGNDYVDWLKKIDDLGSGLNSDDVLNALGDDRLARDWRELIGVSRKDAKNRVKQLLFSYKSTNLDNKLKNVIFFHYWTTRALPMHTKTALKNPWLLNAYARAWQHMKTEAEQNGYPANVQGFIRMMGDETGFYGLVNPMQVLVPFNMLIENSNDPGTYEFLRRWGFFINPVIEGGAASLGWTHSVPDLTETFAVRRAMRYTVNWLNSNGFDGVVPDQLGKPNTWQPSVVDEATYRIFNSINGLIKRGADAIAPMQTFIQDFQGTSKNAYEYDTLNSILQHELEKTYGPIDKWDANSPAWDLYLDAQKDIAIGKSGNPLADTVVEIMSDAKLQSTALNTFVPGGVYQRYGPRDVSMAADDTIARTMATSGSSEDAALTAGMDQMAQLGNEQGRTAYSAWNEIAYGEMTDYNSHIEINGAWIYAEDIKAMSTDERKALADRWVDQYPNATNDLAQYNAERVAFIAKHPEVGTFKEFQKGVYGQAQETGGIKTWRENYAKTDKTFAAAMQAKEKQIRDYMPWKDDQVINLELDQWAASQQAYKVANGIRDSVYDKPVTPKVPDYGFAAKDTSSGGGSVSSTPKDPIQKTRDAITSYQDKLTKTVAILNDSGYNVTEEDVVFASPLYRQAWSGFDVPSLNTDANLYWQWKLLQPSGADTNVDAYIKVLEQMGYQKAA